MEDLQEEIHKLVDDGARLIDEDQSNYRVTVAACLIAATVIKQARNKRLRVRNDRRKNSVWVRQWLLSRDKYGIMYTRS